VKGRLVCVALERFRRRVSVVVSDALIGRERIIEDRECAELIAWHPTEVSTKRGQAYGGAQWDVTSTGSRRKRCGPVAIYGRSRRSRCVCRWLSGLDCAIPSAGAARRCVAADPSGDVVIGSSSRDRVVDRSVTDVPDDAGVRGVG